MTESGVKLYNQIKLALLDNDFISGIELKEWIENYETNLLLSVMRNSKEDLGKTKKD